MNILVRVTKLGEISNAPYKAGDFSSYKIGEENQNESLPIDYYVVGYMTEFPEIGKSFSMDRYIRNGFHALGTLTTSPVLSTQNLGQEIMYFATANSVYKVEEL